MKEINRIIANNLIHLRKHSNMTQLELAQKLNYSDKAVSKWETGETMPDIEVLYNITKIYNVTLDFLTSDNDFKEIKIPNTEKNNKIIITCLCCSVVWIISTIIFVYSKISSNQNLWPVFVWSVPCTTIILIIFNGIWGRRKFTFVLISIFIWSLITCFYLTFIEKNIWPIFLIGIPFQIVIVLWSQLKR